jgi:hypothetical protein
LRGDALHRVAPSRVRTRRELGAARVLAVPRDRRRVEPVELEVDVELADRLPELVQELLGRLGIRGLPGRTGRRLRSRADDAGFAAAGFVVVPQFPSAPATPTTVTTSPATSATPATIARTLPSGMA